MEKRLHLMAFRKAAPTGPVIIILLIHFWPTHGSTCPTKATCLGLNGMMHGGNCFFEGDQWTTWTDAWTTCQRMGGTLAQIHTQAEADELLAWFWVINTVDARMLALRRDTGVPGSPCAVTPTTTYWYSSETTKETSLVAGNTWAATSPCCNCDSGGEYCFEINKWGNGELNDISCNDTRTPLCQFATGEQNYTKTSVCITETPVATMTGSQPSDCATACSQKIWCRSFNFRENPDDCPNSSCELFSWDTRDAGCNSVPSNSSCFSYTYVP